MAHRGSSAIIPESSFQSFNDAYRLEVDVLETDIRLTKDYVPVIFHDESLDRTTNGKGPVLSYAFEQLQEFDLGFWYKDSFSQEYPFRNKGFKIISLLDLFESFPNIRINIDIKDKVSFAPKIVLDTIKEADAEQRTLVGSFHHKQLSRFREISESLQIPTSASPKEVLGFLLNMLIFRKRRFCALQVPPNLSFIKIVSFSSILKAHKRNLAIHTWTINDKDKMIDLLNWGIDGIFTDNPELLLEVLSNYTEKNSSN